MENYKYQCPDCKREYDSEQIESQLIYLCPACGKVEKNKPLQGVLEVVIDSEYLKTISKQEFLSKIAGELHTEFLPLKSNFSSYFDLLKLSPNLYRTNVDNLDFQIFDDTRNITLSYKDRASILVGLKAIELGISKIAAASTGNAGSSLAGICSRLGIESHIFVPKNIPDSKRIQIQSFTKNIYIVDGDYDQAFDLCFEVASGNGWYNRNTAYNPLTIEGKKTSVLDMFILSGGNLPENIFVPIGDGVIIAGIYKGLKELLDIGWINRMPRLIGVQAENSDAVYRFVKENIFEYKPAFTIADSISAGAPRNLYLAARAIKESDGDVLTVSDDEIIEAQKKLIEISGVLAEPAASASFAGLLKAKMNNSVIMITGNGLKDVGSLQNWIEKPTVKSYDEWKSELL